jgi:hypothetical protein
MTSKERTFEDVEWIELIQDRVHSWEHNKEPSLFMKN